jgi:hypothetical protein
MWPRWGINSWPSAHAAKGWTLVLLERASRFIWELRCGRQDRKLFKRAIRTLVKVINTTGDLALITEGEQSSGQGLVELCSERVRTGKRGRPPKTLLIGRNLLYPMRLELNGTSAHVSNFSRIPFHFIQATLATLAEQSLFHPETVPCPSWYRRLIGSNPRKPAPRLGHSAF